MYALALMHKHCLSVVVTTVLLFANSRGLEYNRQRFTQNTDFLQHEGGVNQNTPKNKNSPVADSTFSKSDFPALGPPSTSHTASPQSNPQGSQSTQSSGKRDYVAPNFPPLQTPTNSQQGGVKLTNSGANGPQPNGHNVPTDNKQPSGKRDYVAPSYPTLRPPTSTQQSHAPAQPSTRPAQSTPSTGKRDYVNPNLPASNPPINSQQGKVKDLVNFYDGKSQQPTNPQKPFSYSSILQGSNKNNQGSHVTNQPATSPTTKPIALQTPKPFSFSDIVSGNKHSGSSTSKPSTTRAFSTPSKPSSPTNSGTTRPLVLPSSIANNNRNNQGNNGNSVSETELQTLSEELLRKDTNNAAKFITINYQGKTTSQSKDDNAPLPLLTVSQEAWNIPTIQKFVALLDNYERDTLVNEYVTPQERNEENAFMDAIMSTTVIRHLMSFFRDKGYVTPDPKQQRDFLKQLWFSLYSRGRGKISSSGFEHSFVSELKNGEVSGLHNWIYFTKEEQANRLNYLGYLKYEELNGKGVVMKLHFNQQGVDKPVDSLFIGTSPELEMALYTLCFVTRVDNDCRLKLGGKDVNIITYNFRYRSKNLIGSAYPQI